MNIKILQYSIAVLSLMPIVVSAQSGGLSEMLSAIHSLLSLIIPIVFSLALLYFFWGVTLFLRTAGEADVKEGKAKMIWGIIGLFVMSSIWGILNIFSLDILGINISETRQDTTSTIQPPTDPKPVQIPPPTINSKDELRYNTKEADYDFPKEKLSDAEIDRRLDEMTDDIINGN